MKADLRLALLLTRGSNRREWWRVTLTALGAAFTTGFGVAAVALACVSGQVAIPFAHGLLNRPGERSGVLLTLLLLQVPVLGFLGQCARIGAVHRDRRLAALRLAGASPSQVRRISGLEAGLACLAGSAVTTAVCALLLRTQWHRPPALVWVGFAAVAVAVPLVGALVSVAALRRVVASPLGWVGRIRPTYRDRSAVLALVIPVLLVFAAAALILTQGANAGAAMFPLALLVAVLVTGAGAVAAAGATARLTGRILAARTESPAVLIAAERLRSDPWAAARTHAAVLLVTVVGVGFVGVRELFLDALEHAQYASYTPQDMAFYRTGVNLAGAAVLVALAISLCSLAVGTVESLATRRRGLAAQAAAGVPRAVLGRALLLETALPLAPAMLLAGIGGTGLYTGFGLLQRAGHIPLLLPLLVPVVVYTACLLAAATSLPLLRRSAHPAELRHV